MVKRASKLAEAGDLTGAWKLCDRALKEDPDALDALICATFIYYREGRYTTAYQFARRAAGLGSKNAYCWGNLANVEHELYRFDQGEFCIKKGLECAKDKKQFAFLRKIQAALLIQAGDWERAVRASRIALALQESAKNRANLALALLGVGQWEEAWPLYAEIAGRDRSVRKMQYLDEPVWDGSKGKSIVVYDEQGIGDVISFSSMIPDALKDVKIVMDVRPELQKLLQRSFPEATVYGSFSGLDVDGVEQGIGEDWRAKHQIDASIPISGLARHYRPSPASCPGTPYLKADPEKVARWKAQFAKEGKPVIGIAWSGGLDHTAGRYRAWKLEQLLPVFKAVDAVWVSLQWKDASAEIEAFVETHGVDLRQYPETLSDDYDDTAALVDALDMVFSMQTSVIHLAGALGKECWCFVNKYSQWRYGPPTQKTLPWYKSVRLFRNVDGWPIEEAANELREKWRSLITTI